MSDGKDFVVPDFLPEDLGLSADTDSDEEHQRILGQLNRAAQEITQQALLAATTSIPRCAPPFVVNLVLMMVAARLRALVYGYGDQARHYYRIDEAVSEYERHLWKSAEEEHRKARGMVDEADGEAE